jgi:predicted metalloprotease
VKNPLYEQSMPTTDCPVKSIDITTISNDDLEQHLNEWVECLMYSWYPMVIDSGFQLPRPSVTVYTTPIKTACGELSLRNAHYCSGDQQIYYAQDYITRRPDYMLTYRFLAESIIAHEFGHAVQYRSMIFVSGITLEKRAETEEEKNGVSRRIEGQADCFTGLFLASVTDSIDLSATDMGNLQKLFADMGSSKPYTGSHGSKETRSFWLGTGLQNISAGACGTFSVPDDLVS